MRILRTTIAVAALGLMGATEPPARLPAWMAGCWVDSEGTSWNEECWTTPRGGIMLGSGRTGRGDQLDSWETMQIMLDAPERDGSRAALAFYGSPRGERRTMFEWKPGAGEGDGIGFENPAHDYPQRIRYWRAGNRLEAEIAMLDGSRAIRWTYRRAGSPQ